MAIFENPVGHTDGTSDDDTFSFTEPLTPMPLEHQMITAGAGRDTLLYNVGVRGNYEITVAFDELRGSVNHVVSRLAFREFEAVDITGTAEFEVFRLYVERAVDPADVTLDGGGGGDRLSIDMGSTADLIFTATATGATSSVGTFTNFASYSLRLGSGDDVIYSGAGDDIIEGRASNTPGHDVVYTEGGDDLVWAFGDGHFDGGDGLDTLRISNPSVTSDIQLAVGADGTITSNQGTFVSFERFVLTGGQGNDEIITGAGNDVLNGGAGDDYLAADAGDDVLQGGSGLDTLIGGPGDDTFFVDQAGDLVFEAADEGYDQINASISYVLAGGQHVEWLGLSSTLALDLTGNEIGNTLIGNDAQNTLIGNGGDDSLFGGGGGDKLIGGEGNDTYFVDNILDEVTEQADAGCDSVQTSISYALSANVERLFIGEIESVTAINLTGNDLSNYVVGNYGANWIDGGAGADEMFGAYGDDIYFVDNIGDQVYDSPDGGYDTVFSSVSFTLGAEIERLFAFDPASAAELNFTGNALANEIAGTAGANVIDGGAGADFMNGHGGDDIYFVDDAGDYVFETAGNGFDTVFATFSYTLASDVERVFALDPSSTAALNFTGNDLANELGGTAGANILDGGAGADLMVGADGDDIYFVDNAGDVVSDSPTGGYDTVFASISFVLETRIERVVALDPNSTAALSFTGNAVANEITGNAGSNLIDGGGGADILFGGAGGDAFAFTSALGGGSVAALPDFEVGADRIYLDDAVFAGLAPGALSADAFHVGSAAADASDRIIYDDVTGALYFDADGSGAGAAVQFANLHEGLPITASEFQVI